MLRISRRHGSLKWLVICGLVVACGMVGGYQPGAVHAVQDAAAAWSPAAVAARVAEEVEKQQIVGISVALVQDGQIVHVEHYGWQDREREIPVSDQTMYRWASISKPITAIAAMQLVEAGQLDLDADVRALVPEFPDKEAVITCRQLLCHQSGIVHYRNGIVIRTPRPELEGRFDDVIDALDWFKESPLVATPGEAYAYTTHGYILASAVVQRAGAEPFAEQVARRIAQPLGMASFQPDYQWLAIENRAVGYRRRNDRIVPSSNTDVSWKLGGGGYISNIGDMARFAIGLMSHQLISEATARQMFTRQRLLDGTETSYGLGFTVGRFRRQLLVAHSGSQEKTRTLLMMLPERQLAVAIMCNTEGTDLNPLGRDLLSLLLDSQPAEGAR